MDATLAARFPFEMLHRVGDVNFFTIDPRFFQRAIHNFSGRTDERFPGNVLVIAGLFADEHDRRFLWTFAKNRLSSTLVQMTSGATLRRLAHG
jgi:hypothetical protein